LCGFHFFAAGAFDAVEYMCADTMGMNTAKDLIAGDITHYKRDGLFLTVVVKGLAKSPVPGFEFSFAEFDDHRLDLRKNTNWIRRLFIRTCSIFVNYTALDHLYFDARKFWVRGTGRWLLAFRYS
jgi:hypothetical protein